MKPFRSSLIAVVIFAVLLAVFFFIKPPSKRQQETEDRQLALWQVDPQDVVGIRMTYRESLTKESSIHLERLPSTEKEQMPDSWQITEPARYPADQATVDQLLTALATFRATGLIEESPQDLSPYGLAKPYASLTLATVDKEIVLSVGDKAPVGSFYYAQLAGNPGVFSIENNLLDHLVRPLDAFRNRDLLRFAPSSVLAISVQGPESSWKATPDAKNPESWNLNQNGKDYPVSASEMHQFLQGLLRIRIDRFDADQASRKHLEKRGLQQPSHRLQIQTRAIPDIDLAFRYNGDWTYATERNQTSIYAIQGNFLENLERGPVKVVEAP